MIGLDLWELVLVGRIVRLRFDLCVFCVRALIVAGCSFWRDKLTFL